MPARTRAFFASATEVTIDNLSVVETLGPLLPCKRLQQLRVTGSGACSEVLLQLRDIIKSNASSLRVIDNPDCGDLRVKILSVLYFACSRLAPLRRSQ